VNLFLVFPELPACLVIMLICAIRGTLVERDRWRSNWLLLGAAADEHAALARIDASLRALKAAR
jgi:hypothetical protein